jgi:hypothetical protein
MMQINPFIDREPEKNPQTPMVYLEEKPNWEYRLITRDLEQDKPPGEDEMNPLGAEGWELSGFIVHDSVLYCYFKRMK